MRGSDSLVTDCCWKQMQNRSDHPRGFQLFFVQPVLVIAVEPQDFQIREQSCDWHTNGRNKMGRGRNIGSSGDTEGEYWKILLIL